MRRALDGFDVEGPVQAEVFVLCLRDGDIHLTGPCGPAPWYLEVDADEDPLDVVTAMTVRAVGSPLVSHSTSWRRDRGGVILTFVAVVAPALLADMASRPLERVDIARGSANAAPERIESDQVIEHGLRHLAWLVKDDAVVASELGPGWAAVLAGYTPEPFRALARSGGRS